MEVDLAVQGDNKTNKKQKKIISDEVQEKKAIKSFEELAERAAKRKALIELIKYKQKK